MRPHKILLVEDESLVRMLLKTYISAYSQDFTIIGEAASAYEALDTLDENIPDIVVTDINMPIVSGIEMSRRMRELYPDIHVVVVTGYGDFEFARQGIKIGIEDYILKPVDEKEFIASLFRIRAKYPCPEPEDQKTVAVYGSEQMNNIEKYILDNLSSPQLSLAQTAQYFFMNSSYLSRMFKHRKGISFRDYVNKMRIEKALEYLRNTDIKAYEVGAMVGVEDPNYFSTLVKKYTGMTITQYRSKI